MQLIKVKWPHGGWLIWNWDLCKWEHHAVLPASLEG